MIDHTGVGVTDYAASKAFYDAAMAPLGASLLMTIPKEFTGGAAVVGYGRDNHATFWLSEKTTASTPMHIAFTARSRAEVDASHKAALSAGGRDNGGPGLRPHYHPDYYAAFVFDPDGNNIEAACRTPE